MRFVPLKSLEQQDIQMLHRIRERLIKNRTVLSNQIQGLLAEYGLVMPKGINHLKAHLPSFLEDGTNELSAPARRYFLGLNEKFDEMSVQIKSIYSEKLRINRQHEVCQRLSTITGIEPIVATAFYAGIVDGKAFNSGRHIYAWLSIVPGQHSTAGKPTLLGISKRGNTYFENTVD